MTTIHSMVDVECLDGDTTFDFDLDADQAERIGKRMHRAIRVICDAAPARLTCRQAKLWLEWFLRCHSGPATVADWLDALDKASRHDLEQACLEVDHLLEVAEERAGPKALKRARKRREKDQREALIRAVERAAEQDLLEN
jgi:hypothetical protein